MTNLPEKCPNCQAESVECRGEVFPWYEEDPDGASAVSPSGFLCSYCYEPVGEIKEVKAEAKANCSLFAQPVPEVEPVDPEILKAEREARLVNVIQIEFLSGEFSFQKANDAPVEGSINSQAHQTDLLKRAMEIARDEGKQLRVTNGMDTVTFKSVSDKEIKIHCSRS
jgi:hypothetical protein